MGNVLSEFGNIVAPVVQDISGKADKVVGATSGNLAGLDANGDLTDSEYSAEKLIQSNPNLLDNPFFTVNQRNIASYPSWGLGADRWWSNNWTTVTAHGLVMDGTNDTRFASQIMRLLTDGTYTVSVQDYVSGEISYAIYEVSNGEIRATDITHLKSWGGADMVLDTDTTKMWFRVYVLSGNTKTICRAKLERGSICTISLDTPRPYTEELARCQTNSADPNDTYANKGILISSDINNKNGAKNILNIDNAAGYQSDVVLAKTSSESGIRITNSTSGQFEQFRILVNVDKNTNYIFSSDVTVTSGEGAMEIWDYSISTNIAYMPIYSESGKYNILFNSGNNDKIYAICYCTRETAGVGDVTYESMMLRLASDADPTYAPYAMTNRELTDTCMHRVVLHNITYNSEGYIDITSADLGLPANVGFFIVSVCGVAGHWDDVLVWGRVAGITTWRIGLSDGANKTRDIDIFYLCNVIS